ncbi:M67 family peptidase [bacterium CPR1]|nr:M67 family peptidase [bacterium CPR1]
MGELRQRAQAAAPREICGFMLGRAGRVEQLFPVRNAHRDPIRGYLIPPEESLSVLRRARNLALEILGVYHSHPEGPANLSAVDRQQAHGGWHYLVVGRDQERCWEV